jgi:hypothetical protein
MNADKKHRMLSAFMGVHLAGGPSLHCTIPTEGAPSLRFLQGWAAMLPAQLLSVLHYPLCMPSSYPLSQSTRRTGHPQLRCLLQFEGRATRPSIILVRMPPLKFGEKRKLEEFLGMGGGYVLGFSDRTFREFVHDNTGLDIDDPEVGGMGSKGRRLRHFWDNQPDYIVGKLLKDLIDSVDADPPEESQSFGEVRYGVPRTNSKLMCFSISRSR